MSFAGWNNSVKAPSKRIEVISGVEEYFTDKSLGDELIEALKGRGITVEDKKVPLKNTNETYYKRRI